MTALLVSFGAAFAGAAAALRYANRLLRSRWVVPAFVTGSAIGGLVAEGAATGLAPFDAVLRAVLCGAVAAGGTAVSPVFFVVAGAVGVFLGAGAAGSALGGAAVGVALGALVSGRGGEPHVRGVAAALVAQSALRLAWPTTTGVTAAAAAFMLVPALWMGFRLLSRPTRRAIGWSAAALVVAGTVFSALALATALGVKPDVDAAVRASRQALDAVGEASTPQAAARFDTAAAAFRRASDRMGAWWVMPARAVPIVGQHVRAIDDLSRTGARLSVTGKSAIDETDVHSLRLVDGTLDLQAVEALRAPVSDILDRLNAAVGVIDDVRSPWLLGPVTDRIDELEQRVDRARNDASLIHEAVDAVPGLLGANGPRRYFLAVMTPSESRPSGGLIGNWGEIVADHGHLDLTRFGRTKELNDAGDPSARTLEGPSDYLKRYAQYQPQITWQNVPFSPDFPSVADVIEQLYPQSGGEHVDGVIGIDPEGLAAFLRLVGPVKVPGWPQKLTAHNAAKILLYDQYVTFPETERVDFLGDATKQLWKRLTSTSLPAPDDIGKALGPASRARHIQMVTVDHTSRRFLERLHVTGEIPPLDGDSVGVFSANSSGNKIDWFLHRSVVYRPTVDLQTGATRAHLTVTFRNEAPASGLPRSIIGSQEGVGPNPTKPSAPVENRLIVSVYSPLALRHATLDGGPVEVTPAEELGRYAYTAQLVVPPHGTRTLELELAGNLPVDDGYRLTLLNQPMVHPDEYEVVVDPRSETGSDTLRGLQPGPRGTATARVTLDHPARLGIIQTAVSYWDRFAGG